jgi:hypothetical protein
MNVSRGALIDSVALLDALRRHQIAGAALDVFEKELLPADSPLWKSDNRMDRATPCRADQKALGTALQADDGELTENHRGLAAAQRGEQNLRLLR